MVIGRSKWLAAIQRQRTALSQVVLDLEIDMEETR